MDCTNGLGYVVHGDVCERRVLMKSEMCMQRGQRACIRGARGPKGGRGVMWSPWGLRGSSG